MANYDQKILTREYKDLTERFGNYLSLDIDFAHDNEIIPAAHYGLFLKRLIRIIADFSKKPFSSLRILDIGSYEGFFSIELARTGAEVLGIEGRASNIAKAEFLQKISGIQNIAFMQDDVRNITKEKYGQFDIIIAAGILYHLEAESVVKLCKNMFAMCNDIAIVDTQIALSRRAQYTLKGRTYHGIDYKEPSATGTEFEKIVLNPQDGIGNIKSFWPTEVSLYALFVDAGFTSVAKVVSPAVDEVRGAYDRVTLITRKGAPLGDTMSKPLAKLAAAPLKEIIGEQIMVQMANASGEIIETPSGVIGHDWV